MENFGSIFECDIKKISLILSETLGVVHRGYAAYNKESDDEENEIPYQYIDKRVDLSI